MVSKGGAARGEQVGFEGLDAAGQPLEGLIRVLDVAAYVVVQLGEVVADGAEVVLEAADAAPEKGAAFGPWSGDLHAFPALTPSVAFQRSCGGCAS